jgi:hypothetical protein
LAVYSVHKNFGEQLLPDGPELMEKFISNETDMSGDKRGSLACHCFSTLNRSLIVEFAVCSAFVAWTF